MVAYVVSVGTRRLTRRGALAALAVVLAMVASPVLAQASQQYFEICAGESVTLEVPPGYDSNYWGPDSLVRRVNRAPAITVRPPETTTYHVDLQSLLGPNLVENFDLTEGNVAFESEYTYRSDTSDVAVGEYTITGDPSSLNPAYGRCRDVSRLSMPEWMLVARGLGDPGTVVWRQTVDVEPDKQYLIVVFTAMMTTDRAVALQVRIDGEVVANPFEVAGGRCVWRQHSEIWQSGTRETVTVEVSDVAANRGVVFGLDAAVVAERPPDVRELYEVVVHDTTTTVVEVGLCPGQRYRRNGLDLGPGDVGRYTLSSIHGCDSAIQIRPYLLSTARDTALVEACAGDTVLIFGEVLTRSGVRCTTLTSAAGCDSVVCAGARFFGHGDVRVTTEPTRCPGTADGRAAVAVRRAGTTVRWADGTAGARRTDLAGGDYAYTVTSAAGCEVTGELTIAEPEPLRWAGNLNEPLDLCLPERLGDITATGGTGALSLAFRQNGLLTPATQLTPGVIELEIRDANGCQRDTTLVADGAAGKPLVVVGATRVLRGETTVYSARVDGAAPSSVRLLTWSLGGLPLPDSALAGARVALAPERSGWLAVRDDGLGDCERADSLYIEVVEPIRRYFPSAFSPNGDGVNDAFFAVPDTSVARIEELQVYDRWGTQIFTRADCALGAGGDCAWKGLGPDGRHLDSGVYLYRARLRLTDGSVVEDAGDVLVYGAE